MKICLSADPHCYYSRNLSLLSADHCKLDCVFGANADYQSGLQDLKKDRKDLAFGCKNLLEPLGLLGFKMLKTMALRD